MKKQFNTLNNAYNMRKIRIKLKEKADIYNNLGLVYMNMEQE